MAKKSHNQNKGHKTMLNGDTVNCLFPEICLVTKSSVAKEEEGGGGKQMFDAEKPRRTKLVSELVSNGTYEHRTATATTTTTTTTDSVEQK